MKSSRNLPQKVRDLDFTKLTGAQVTIFAEWMGCRKRVASAGGLVERRNLFRTICLENETRAQRGYETIILGQEVVGPNAGALPEQMETRMYEVMTDVVQKHRESLGDHAAQAVHVAAENVKKGLEVAAREAVREAAEKRSPLVIKSLATGKTKKVGGVLPPEYKRLLELASARIPIMIVGPAGCGKTYISEKIAEALDIDYSDQSCSEGMSESVFNGRLLPIGKGGSFVHVLSPYQQRYIKGGVMLLDEIDAGDANLFTYINKSVANESYTCEQRFEAPVLKKHKDFVLIAAANTFGNGADAMYVGRNQLDAATIDRFKIGMVTMDYSRDVEASIASERCKKSSEALCEWAWAIRERIRTQKLRRIMSTRVIKDLATMTGLYDWKAEDWSEAYFTGWTEAERKLVA